MKLDAGASGPSLRLGRAGAEKRHPETIDALFVQSAAGFEGAERSITLIGLSPATLYFADRPRREVGHISSRRFVDLWDEGENSFLIDPPTAVISFVSDEDGQPEDAVVVLLEPRLTGDALTYTVEVLGRNLPERGGACSLIIDAFSRPSPWFLGAIVSRRERGFARPA